MAAAWDVLFFFIKLAFSVPLVCFFSFVLDVEIVFNARVSRRFYLFLSFVPPDFFIVRVVGQAVRLG